MTGLLLRTDSLRGALPLIIAVFLLSLAGGCVQQRRVTTVVEQEQVYWPAESVAQRLGMKVTRQTPLGVTMSDGRNTVSIFTGANGYIYLNGRRIGPPDNAIFDNGKVYVRAAREGLLRSELRNAPPPGPLVPPPLPPVPPGPIRATIVVDPGHGGRDPGTNGRGRSPVAEKWIVLDIAKLVAQRLSERGANVIMTRTGDTYPDLDERCAVAERMRADAFVSIHVDSAARSDASGATVYIGTNASTESVRIARSIEAALLKSGVQCNGIQSKRLRVLCAHSRPAVLVECGFLTNYTEMRRLNTPEYRAAVALAIADGVAEHFARR